MEKEFERKEYSASAVKHLFWFMEFRKVVTLLSEGLTMDEVRTRNKEENIFGCPMAHQNLTFGKTVQDLFCEDRGH